MQNLKHVTITLVLEKDGKEEETHIELDVLQDVFSAVQFSQTKLVPSEHTEEELKKAPVLTTLTVLSKRKG